MSAETMREARRFDGRSNRYRDAGLCYTCAPQAAYGHVDGWGEVHPPCASCAPIVATFPTPTSTQAWRSLAGDLMTTQGPMERGDLEVVGRASDRHAGPSTAYWNGAS